LWLFIPLHRDDVLAPRVSNDECGAKWQRKSAKAPALNGTAQVETTIHSTYNSRALADQSPTAVNRISRVQWYLPMTVGATIGKTPVFRITMAQVVLLAPMSVALAYWDRAWALSVFCGGLVAVVPQAWFATRTFRYRGARSARAVARAGYAGEVGKFLLSAAGFAAVFILLRPVAGAAVFAGYLLMLAIQITGSWMLLRQAPASDAQTQELD
jgi:ATP synthase protein I